jgi:3-(3-hydroxy-phenyl)propionate hydroxylase
MSPAPGAERLFRDAVLHLAARAPFARPLVNSGRLSRPCTYPLTAPDAELPIQSRPGAVAPDAPIPQGWLIDHLGQEPVLLAINQTPPTIPGLKTLTLAPTDGLQSRYLGTQNGALYLIRPDQIVAARWLTATAADLTHALSAIWQDQP